MKTFKVLPIALICMGLGGCASTSDSDSFMPSLTSSSADTPAQTAEDVSSIYQSWQERMESASDMAFYSPETYKKMLEQWQETQDIYAQIAADPSIVDKRTSLLSFSTYGDKFNDSVEELSKQYDKLTSIMNTANSLIPDAIEQNAYLIENNFDTRSPTGFQNLSRKYQALFNYIATNQLDKAKQYQTIYLDSAFSFEVQTVKTEMATPLTTKLSLAKQKGMSQLAPQTFTYTEKSIQAVVDKIEADPRAKEDIEELVSQADFEFKHLEQVSGQVKALRVITEGKFEPTILRIENKLLKLSQAIDDSDYRDEELTTQIDKILSSVTKMQSELSSMEGKVDKLEKTAAEAKALKAQLKKAIAVTPAVEVVTEPVVAPEPTPEVETESTEEVIAE